MALLRAREKRLEQNKIKLAVYEAIPEDVQYGNLVIAFAEMIAGFAWDEYKKDVPDPHLEKPDDETTN